ncbi:MAG: hypothetical protein E7813_12465 [Bradyrhizobium sp.]|nr:MAG: hypothetical protein E7813_12465 [Bradyrhizobium sp.]
MPSPNCRVRRCSSLAQHSARPSSWFDVIDHGGEKSAQAAFDSAGERGNRLLRQLERADPER